MLKIVFTGIGGQGIITAGVVLAEAAVIEEGHHATQSQSYGAEARGGLTRTDVILSDSEVLFPKIDQAHVLAVMHQRGYAACAASIRPGGILIHDESVHVGDKTDARRVRLSVLAEGRGANMALLGAVCGLAGAVAPDSIRAVIRRRYGEGSSNGAAFDYGLEMVTGPEYDSYRLEAR